MKENIRLIEIEKKIQEKNDVIADRIRQKRKDLNIPMIDIMGSVGSGKTSLLEYLAKHYQSKYNLLVINGDLATNIDAERIGKYGSTCLQINTGRGCHLMAYQIEQALESIAIEDFDYIFVENVGNLICPSSTEVGADYKIVVTSVTEGPYVFEKHPITFKMGKYAILNKIDLAEAMEINAVELLNSARKLYPNLEFFMTSTKTGEGIDILTKKIGIK